MTDKDEKKIEESPEESKDAPAPGAVISMEGADMVQMIDVEVDLEAMRTLSTGATVLRGNVRLKPAEDVLEAKRKREQLPFSDRELTPLQRWEEMGRIAKAIEHACVSGNMVGIQHAAQEIAFYWRELEKQRSNTACDLVFQTPSQAFEDGMAELLGVEEAEGMAPQLEEEPPSDILMVGKEYSCPECGEVREIPGVGVYGRVKGLYLPSRGHNDGLDDLVCPSCGFIVGHHYAGKTFWEKSCYEPQGIFMEKAAAEGSVEHHIWDRLERLEAHIKAVESSIPAMIRNILKEDAIDEELKKEHPSFHTPHVPDEEDIAEEENDGKHRE